MVKQGLVPLIAWIIHCPVNYEYGPVVQVWESSFVSILQQSAQAEDLHSVGITRFLFSLLEARKCQENDKALNAFQSLGKSLW